MKTKFNIIVFFLCLFHLKPIVAQDQYYKKAKETLQIVDKLYAVNDGKFLYRENYPYDEKYSASYLGGGVNENKTNPYSYLWPFSGSLSAYTVLLEKENNPKVRKHIDQKILPGLEQYFDTREPVGYASYVKFAPQSDRFYDDNIWLGIDFLDLYLHTKHKSYLDKAEEIWNFVESGMDDKLGGGIYWMEQKKESKNTCSNAPAVVYLMKLYEATNSMVYLDKAKQLYQWTKSNLQDPQDKVYWDNIKLNGNIGKAKYPYNTGQMIQAGVLLFNHTKDKKYLNDAKESAAGGYAFFFDTNSPIEGNNGTFPTLKRSDNWFIAVMLRGYIELYKVDKNKTYIDAYRANLNKAWTNMRDKNGLFGKNWHGNQKASNKKWLLDQFAIAEMYARISKL